MNRIIGILPAGGEATRFSGIYKELLPISSSGDCGLTRCVTSMVVAGASEIHVATNSKKLPMQYDAVGKVREVRFQPGQYDGLWEVILEAARLEASRYFFAMPDTVYPVDVFKRMPDSPVVAGVFTTFQPERFGVFWQGEILDKHDLPVGHEYTAWGTWSWSREAMIYLKNAVVRYRDHTPALNDMLKKFGYTEHRMPYYFDFARFQDYKEYLCSPISDHLA